jgi:hypothetical protein
MILPTSGEKVGQRKAPLSTPLAKLSRFSRGVPFCNPPLLANPVSVRAPWRIETIPFPQNATARAGRATKAKPDCDV